MERGIDSLFDTREERRENDLAGLPSGPRHGVGQTRAWVGRGFLPSLRRLQRLGQSRLVNVPVVVARDGHLARSVQTCDVL